MTLYGDFHKDNHFRIHKWHHYFAIYEQHFARFRNRHVTIFEIGVGEGGSLHQWRDYFGPFAIIVGIDIYPRCKQIEDGQIYIRIGSQDDLPFLAQVVAEFGHPDIVIDDGSHYQPHINATFDFMFPLVAKNGVYLVEDLHAAYWHDCGGGLHDPGSFIERAKSCIDEMHAEYTGGAISRSAVGDRTTSISFYDSVVVFEVGEYRVKRQRLAGNPAMFDNDWTPAGETPENFRRIVDGALSNKAAKRHSRAFEELPTSPSPTSPPESSPPHEAAANQAGEAEADRLRRDLQALREEVALLRGSRSWRITSPLRAMGRFLKGRGDR